MPPSQTRSRSGCLTCKTRRKKCDETKPFCQRCERSGIQCSGYSYLGGSDEGKVIKNWTQPAYSMPIESLPALTRISRTARNGRSSSSSVNSSSSRTRQGTHEGAPSRRGASSEFASGSDASPDLFNSPFDIDPNLPSYTTTNEAMENWWNLDPSLLSLDQQVGDTSRGLQHQPFESSDISTISDTVNSPSAQYDLVPQSLTPGQASLFQALFSLSDSTSDPHPTTRPPIGYPQVDLSSLSSHSPHANMSRAELEDGDDEDESVKQIIYGTMRLDMNAEGNTLPYVLESYAAWITRTAFEPKKAAPGTRDLILKQFGDSEDSRWTVTTLARVVRTLAESSTWGDGLDSLRNLSYLPAVRALREQVHQKVDEVLSYSGPVEGQELSNALKVMGNVMERNMLFHYDTTYDPSLSQPAIQFSGEAGLQWLHGIPDVIVIVFARINTMCRQGYADSWAVAETESMLRNFLAVPCLSSDPFLTVARIMVQECWRQVAFIYLYMGACRVNADDEKVKKALSRFMKLLEELILKQEGPHPGSRTPFDCCALSFQPFDFPVCARNGDGTGTVFELTNIIPWLKEHNNTHPHTSEPLKPADLVKLHYGKNSSGALIDPITMKPFSEHSHIVAIATTGNVFLADSVSKFAGGRDLVADTAFKKEDVITLQDPHRITTLSIAAPVLASGKPVEGPSKDKEESKTEVSKTAKPEAAAKPASTPLVRSEQWLTNSV
ncbi:unnamed protein product [Rhizoctonia solani]|uniref:Zn(2)-C6 fungal-type domain-containing protein n=1 Tax=Rhizoctonia solani TaxID=456999 RepID=A0A8H3AY67_9AGAM|nr:unnamed protein product [Rhizoctonia solani]